MFTSFLDDFWLWGGACPNAIGVIYFALPYSKDFPFRRVLAIGCLIPAIFALLLYTVNLNFFTATFLLTLDFFLFAGPLYRIWVDRGGYVYWRWMFGFVSFMALCAFWLAISYAIIFYVYFVPAFGIG